MSRDVRRRAACAALTGILALPLGPTARAVDLYARAIGDPYAYQPSPSAPRGDNPPSAPPAGQAEAPALPGLGSEETGAPASAGSGWSWGRVLVGIAIVGAMAALANKGGGGGEVAVGTSGGSSTTSGGGATDSGSGGSGADTSPLPSVPSIPGDDDGDKKGKKR